MRYLLLDRIEALEPGRSIHGSKTVAMSEDYLTWHFPGRPILPGVLVLEAFTQLAGWLVASDSGFERWFLLEEVHSARWFAFAVPGDRVELALTVAARDGDRLRVTGESRVAGARAAQVELSGRVVELAPLEDPAAARRAFQVLRREAP